jgi:hypothetical protein
MFLNVEILMLRFLHTGDFYQDEKGVLVDDNVGRFHILQGFYHKKDMFVQH